MWASWCSGARRRRVPAPGSRPSRSRCSTSRPAMRNFELGIEHGCTPQTGLGGGGGTQVGIFQPLLGPGETLAGANVAGQLNPLVPPAAINTLQISRATPFVSAYRTRFGDQVSLAP